MSDAKKPVIGTSTDAGTIKPMENHAGLVGADALITDPAAKPILTPVPDPAAESLPEETTPLENHAGSVQDDIFKPAENHAG
ncbi:hypothetical protein [Streptomyces sp. NPDC086023]|uniref:hypothetical protein n=1 Tax=unclassified Streptomyces TaxID=2593676 RepID=UPI0037CD734E